MNKMPEVAKLLGVEMGEWFEAVGSRYRLTEKGLTDGGIDTYSALLNSLLTGGTEIKKLPFRPKKGETYYFVSDTGYIGATSNWLKDFDYAYMAFGNCFRSESEAEANKDKILAKFEEIKKEMEG